MRRLYLDVNATTPVAPEVRRAMAAALDGDGFGNPSSGHWAGRPAKASLEAGRGEVAALLGCAPDEIVFTGSGSEADNLALQGIVHASPRASKHVVTTAIEHPAVLEPCRFLERPGVAVTVLPVDGAGRVDPEDLARAIRSDTVLVSIMHANNEVGTLQPIAACAAIARAHGIPFHTDAAQSVGKVATRVDDLGVDLLTIAGHKLYAPKGVGALYVRRGTALEPLIHGAGHEAGRRAGTESASLATGLGAACRLARERDHMTGVAPWRDRLWDGLRARFGDRVLLNGHAEERLPNTLNVAFVGRVGAEILAACPEIAASTGSACHAGRIELSPVLAAMGVAPEVGMGAVRFSLGRETTADEVDAAVAALERALAPAGS
ncbi:MAG: cysteine desulfurase family protein [Alphaproteobacteria bacterium]